MEELTKEREDSQRKETIEDTRSKLTDTKHRRSK